jgi:hypothetical protein
MFAVDLSGMGNSTGMKSPFEEGDGDNVSPMAGTETESGEFSFTREGRERSVQTRRG